MAVKATGAEFKRFYADDSIWPKDSDTYHEDETVVVDGEDRSYDFDYSRIPDDAKVVISGGVVFSNNWDNEAAPSFETYFKRWRKRQSIGSFAVEAPLDKIDAIKQAVKEAGGKVL